MFIFFFFKQKTAYEMRISDWSSDVCSSDLPLVLRARVGIGGDHGAAESIGGDQKRRVRRQREAFDIAAEDSGKQNRRVDGRLDGGLFLDRQEDRLHGPKPSSSYSAIVAMIARGAKTFKNGSESCRDRVCQYV